MQCDGSPQVPAVPFDHQAFREYLVAERRHDGQAKRALGRTSHHEAGHAVASISLRLSFLWVAVRPLPEDLEECVEDLEMGESFNRFHYGIVAARPSRVRTEDYWGLAHEMLVQAYAGPIAERRFAGSRGRLRGMAGDRAAIAKLLNRGEEILGPTPRDVLKDPFAVHAKARAVALVDRKWPQIQAVAAALIEKRFLTRREVGRVVRGQPVSPAPSYRSCWSKVR